MKHLDQKQFDKIWSCLHIKAIRDLLLFLDYDGAYTYTEIQTYMQERTQHKSHGLVAYHVKQLVNCGILRKDVKLKRYCLTRVGIRCLELIKDFIKICTMYDLDDLDAEGSITLESTIKGRMI